MMHYLKFTDEAEFLFEFDSYVDDEEGLLTSEVFWVLCVEEAEVSNF